MELFCVPAGMTVPKIYCQHLQRVRWQWSVCSIQGSVDMEILCVVGILSDYSQYLK